MSSLPSSIKRDHKFEKICKALDDSFGGTLQTCHNILRAHLAAGEIPDPHMTPYEICERVLNKHHEAIKKTECFLSHSSREDTDIESSNEINLTKLLDLLPNRVWMESNVLSAPATNITERRNQYDTFKQWVTKEKRKISCLKKRE